MGLFDRILGNDHERAAKYSGPSASETAAAKRRTGHRRSIPKAERAARKWEDRDRQKHPSAIPWFRQPR